MTLAHTSLDCSRLPAGFTTCDRGDLHWGTNGAAGLLLVDGGSVLLQQRAPAVHEGGTWSIPGGAIEAGESAVQAAMREASEEAGLVPGAVELIGTHTADCGGWRYVTIVARPTRPLTLNSSPEATALTWVPFHAVTARPLHEGFAAAWPHLRAIAAEDPVIGWRLFGLADHGHLVNPYIEQANMLAQRLEQPLVWRSQAEAWRPGLNKARCALPTRRGKHKITKCSCGIHAILDHDEFDSFSRSWLTAGVPSQMLEDTPNAALVRPWLEGARMTHAVARLALSCGITATASPVDMQAWPSTVRAGRARLVDVYVRDDSDAAAIEARYGVRVYVVGASNWPPKSWKEVIR